MPEQAKREKARRVWRLNKKEGIPVLEALESVDISKDVYYRIKNEREEEWEEELLTAEQIQNRLAELGEDLEKLENRADRVNERFQETKSDLIDLDSAVTTTQDVWELERKVEEMKEEIEEIKAQKGINRNPDVMNVQDLQAELEELQALEIGAELSELDRRVGNNRDFLEDIQKEVRELRDDMPRSIFDLF